jgi:uncharacterized membrane protein
MKWNGWYRVRSYVRSSLWIVPFIAMPLALASTRVSHWLDDRISWTFLGFGVPGAQAMLNAIVSATLAFVVFTFGSLLVAIQIASGQLTPRIIATTLLRDQVVRLTVGLFLFTLLFALGALGRIETSVHQLVVFLAALFCLCCFAAFLYLIDYASRLLRPISILTRVSKDGLAVIASVYPDLSLGPVAPNAGQPALGEPARIIRHGGTSEIVLAVNLPEFTTQARLSGGVIEFVPRVGDFVAVNEPLLNLYGAAATLDDEALCAAIAFGSERTLEQDPTFAFRIVVDIALRALSPAINDPTTAVLAIDQLHRMLRMVGTRHLRTDEIVDGAGRLLVVFRTPNWEDFVNLSFSEIRHCGANNLQIVRRLRAMIENLIQTLSAHRHAALYQQLGLLDRELRKHFVFPEDLALASVGDSQGLGGHSPSTESKTGLLAGAKR